MNIYEKYKNWIDFTEIPIEPKTWLLLSGVVTIGMTTAMIIIFEFILGMSTLIPYAVGLATCILSFGYPYLKTESMLGEVEKNFSDALKQMSDTLKAGDTYESALKEVANSNYGKLSREMEIALIRLEEGDNFETALKGLSKRIDSRLVKRTITIIIESVKTGAGLSNLLDEIADDVKGVYKLKESRKANTTMQFMFMVVAGGLIAPLIFGEVTAITATFSQIGANVQSTINVSNAQTNFIYLLIQAYIIIEVIATSTMMAVIREGKVNKTVIYLPFLLLVAYITYYMSLYGAKLMLKGAF